MGRYRKLLVAIDGSIQSIHALRESFKFAVDEKCWITVVSVVPPYEGELELVGVNNIRAAMQQPHEKALSEAVEIAKSERVLVRTVLEEGEPYERIVDLAEAENCDLIITGRTGRSNVQKALVGSVAARVIGYSQKDVLVIPSRAAVGWKNIFFAADGSKYSLPAGARAVDFARSYGGALTIMTVVDVPAEFYGEAPETVDKMIEKARSYVEEVKSKSRSSGVTAEALVREGEASRVIVEYAREKSMDVIVMGSHGRTGLRRLLMGSVAEKVIGYSDCPVLVVRS